MTWRQIALLLSSCCRGLGVLVGLAGLGLSACRDPFVPPCYEMIIWADTLTFEIDSVTYEPMECEQ